MLTISANDFGPIAKGTVELRPFTIFMGRSNTGKSFMAAAIYALMTAPMQGTPALYGRGVGFPRRRYWHSVVGEAQADREILDQ